MTPAGSVRLLLSLPAFGRGPVASGPAWTVICLHERQRDCPKSSDFSALCYTEKTDDPVTLKIHTLFSAHLTSCPQGQESMGEPWVAGHLCGRRQVLCGSS